MKTIRLDSTKSYKDTDRWTVEPARYVWRGPTDQPVFRYADCREIVCADVVVECEHECSSVFEIVRTKAGPSVIPSTLHQFRNVRIEGDGKPLFGFHVHSTATDENGEHMRWDCVSVYGCAVGWSMHGQQAKEQLLTNCRFESGVTALSSDTGFQWIGGAVSGCDTGIFLTRVGDPVRISGVGFEACKRLLLTVNASTDAQPIVLDSCRYAADQLHDDGAMIVLCHAGPLTLIGGSYGDGAQRIPQIELAGIGRQAVNLIGPKFGSFGADQINPIRSRPGVVPIVNAHGLAYQCAADSSARTLVTGGLQ